MAENKIMKTAKVVFHVQLEIAYDPNGEYSLQEVIDEINYRHDIWDEHSDSDYIVETTLIDVDINTDEDKDDMFYYYLDYLHLEVGLLVEDIATVPLSGSADASCSEIAKKEYVVQQLADIPDDKLFDAVRKLCDNPEITSREQAIEYIVWITASNIKEEPEWCEKMGEEVYVITIPR